MKRLLLSLSTAVLAVLAGCAQQNQTGKEGDAMADITGKNILMIIAGDKFRDEELFEPHEILTDAGADITIASSKVGTITGMLGGKAQATLDITQANPADYHAVIFVGGSGSSEYFDNSTVHKIATDATAAGKVVGAICIAPSTLANAGLLKGKKATCYASQKSNLLDKQANYTGKGVEIDGNIITADGPASATAFGKAILTALQ